MGIRANPCLISCAPGRWFRPRALRHVAAEGLLRFAPKVAQDDFDTAFVLPRAWGRLKQRRTSGRQVDEICVESGALALRTLVLDGGPKRPASVAVTVGRRKAACQWELKDGEVVIRLAEEIALEAGGSLKVTRNSRSASGDRFMAQS